MLVEPIIQLVKNFTNVLEFTFMISDHINYIRRMIINIGFYRWCYTTIRSMSG